MRTTLDVDDDVLQAAKEIAAARKSTAGRVLSELARKGLERPRAGRSRNGVPLMTQPAGSPLITMDLVTRLRDE
jgi:hypothetical protein